MTVTASTNPISALGDPKKVLTGKSLMGVMTGEKKILRATAAGGTSSGSAAVAGTGTDTYRERTQKSVETGEIKRK